MDKKPELISIYIANLALRVIEGLTFEDIDLPAETKINQIYKFAHVGVGRCQNKHEDWLKELKKAEKALIEHGIISAESWNQKKC